MTISKLTLNYQLAALCFIVSSQIAFAEKMDEAHPHQLEDIIVSSPMNQSLSETALPVQIISDDELRRKIAPTIGETLENELGITNQSFGPGVGQPVIRGQSGSRVQVLQNSLGSLDASSLSPDHANSTEPLWADRIEVLRGPATLLYGSGAIGGIVNVIDNRIPDHLPERLLQGAIEQRYNTANEGVSSAFKLEGGKDMFAFHIDGFYRESIDLSIPGYAVNESAEAQSHGEEEHAEEEDVFNSQGRLKNTNTRARGGSAGFSLIGDAGFIGVSVNHLDSRYGVPPGAHQHAGEEDHDAHADEMGNEDFERVRIHLEQTRYDLKAELYDPFSFAESLRLRIGYNDYQHMEIENGTPGTIFKNKGVLSRLELVQKPWWIFDHGVIGVQTQNSEFSALGDEAIVPKSDIDSFGFFTVQDIHTENVTYEIGLRVEQQFIDPKGQQRSAHTPISFSTSALWDVTESESVSLSFSRSERAPDVQELYANGAHLATQAYNQGNVDLQVETAHYLELGFHVKRDWIQADFNLYQNWVQDYIASVNNGLFYDSHDDAFVNNCDEADCLPVFASEQEDAQFTGFEAQVSIPLLKTAYGTLETQLFSDYVRGRFDNGNDIPRMPPLRYGMGLSWRDDNWGANVRVTQVEKQENTGENETVTPSYVLLNVGADYRFKMDNDRSLFFFVKGNNLLNQDIRNATSYLRNVAPSAARSVELGLRIGF